MTRTLHFANSRPTMVTARGAVTSHNRGPVDGEEILQIGLDGRMGESESVKSADMGALKGF